MLELLAPKRVLLSDRNAFDEKESRPTATASTSNARTSISSAQFSTRSRDSARPRSSSLSTYFGTPSSKNDYDIPHLVKTPWEIERSKKRTRWRRSKDQDDEDASSSSAPKRFPREVYDCILQQLEQLHFTQNGSCPPCYMRDLCNLSLTSRAWDRSASVQLYRKVWVLTGGEHSRMPKLRVNGTSRLKLLRRTLRDRAALARNVCELELSDIQSLYLDATIEREEILNLVASLVMACPNLERVTGFHVPYTHDFDRLSYALSTRRNLKERVWLLSDKGEQSDEEEDADDPNSRYYSAANDPTEQFLEFNSNHPNLTTLVLDQDTTDSVTSWTFRSIIGTFRQLPALRHLSISGFSAAVFTNLALNALPPNLQSLRLENLSGINDKGLQRFSASSIPTSLESLTLIDLEISNLAIVSNILSPHLGNLKRFLLSQHKTPVQPANADVALFQSETLSYIHWELRSQAGPPPTLQSAFAQSDVKPQFPFANHEPIACLATSLLATSIKLDRFPALRTIRAPHDPQGLLQAVCKPRATALLPSDTTLLASIPRQSQYPAPLIEFATNSGSSPTPSEHSRTRGYNSAKSRSDSVMSSSPTSSSDPDANPFQPYTPLHSRIQAQSRILTARKQTFISVRVTDPAGNLRINKPLFGFMGQVDSKITYELRPDRARSHDDLDDLDDEEEDMVNEWLTTIGDIIGEWEEVVPAALDGCNHGERTIRAIVPVEELF